MSRHEVDVFSLVTGLAIIVLAGTQLLGITLDVSVDVRYLWPTLLVGLGVLGLISVWRAVRRGDVAM